MNVVSGIQQGTQEWLDLRKNHLCASDAPVIMSASKYKTRDEYIHEKATGFEPEHSEHTQRLFARGHEAEASARAIIEAQIAEDLFPATCVSNCDTYLASVDGMTMDGSLIFEHKLLNDDLRNQIEAGELSPQYYWQLEHIFLVTGATKALFVASDGTAENMLKLEYNHVPERREQLIKGWMQVCHDVSIYEPQAPQVEAVGVSPESLPALSVQVTGMVTASNLDQFRDHALMVINSINTDLQTDDDFASADKACRWCKDVESRLAATKEQVIGQMATVDAVCRAIDEISATTRDKRLVLEKLVKSQKDARRGQIVGEAKMAWADYMKGVNAQFDVVRLDLPCPDFATAIKGKKTLSSIQSACNDLLAKSKIEAMEKADLYRANLKVFAELTENHGFLFRNLQSLVDQPSAAFEAIIKQTIADYEAQQKAKREAELKRMEEEAKAKAEAEREKIRREEQAKAEAEQQRKAAEERQREKEAREAQIRLDEERIQAMEIATDKRLDAAMQKPTMLEAEAQRMKAKTPDLGNWIPKRPTLNQVVALIADRYSVDEKTAWSWMYELTSELKEQIA
jgi:putative phage-type endonuclease